MQIASKCILKLSFLHFQALLEEVPLWLNSFLDSTDLLVAITSVT